jgi:hypothetical protein
VYGLQTMRPDRTEETIWMGVQGNLGVTELPWQGEAHTIDRPLSLHGGSESSPLGHNKGYGLIGAEVRNQQAIRMGCGRDRWDPWWPITPQLTRPGIQLER